MYLKFWIIPFISALIGYLTNVVAIRLLFWPQKPINLIFLKFQGLLPKRHADIAVMLGELVEKELLSIDDVIDKINTPEMHKKIMNRLNTAVKNRLNMILPGIIPARIKTIIMSSLEKVLNQEVPYFIDSILESNRDYISNEIRISKLVENRINEFDINKLEGLIRGVSSAEIVFIEVMGGILGLLIGLVQVGILILFPL